MEKHDRSELLSLFSVILFAGILLCLLFTAPILTKWYINFSGRPQTMFLPIIITFYSVSPFATGVLYCLARLLISIRNSNVFTDNNVRLLRIISILLFIAALIFFAAGFFYMPFFIIAVAAAFVVLIVRVVKNCFEAAVVLKDENELTI